MAHWHSVCELNTTFNNFRGCAYSGSTIFTEDKWNRYLNDNEHKHTDATMTFNFTITNKKYKKKKKDDWTDWYERPEFERWQIQPRR